MQIVLVGNRNGKATIHWSGVIISSLIVTAVSVLGGAAFMFAIDWYSPVALLMPAVLAVGCVIGTGVVRGLRLPPEQLPPLGPVA